MREEKSVPTPSGLDPRLGESVDHAANDQRKSRMGDFKSTDGAVKSLDEIGMITAQ